MQEAATKAYSCPYCQKEEAAAPTTEDSKDEEIRRLRAEVDRLKEELRIVWG